MNKAPLKAALALVSLLGVGGCENECDPRVNNLEEAKALCEEDRDLVMQCLYDGRTHGFIYCDKNNYESTLEQVYEDHPDAGCGESCLNVQGGGV